MNIPHFSRLLVRSGTHPPGYEIPDSKDIELPHGSCWFVQREKGVDANFYHCLPESRGVTTYFLRHTIWGYEDKFGNKFETLNEFLASLNIPMKPLSTYTREPKKFAVLVEGRFARFFISQIVNNDEPISWVLSNAESIFHKATSFDGFNWFVNDESRVFKTLDELKSPLKILMVLRSYYLTSLKDYEADPLDRTKPLSL